MSKTADRPKAVAVAATAIASAVLAVGMVAGSGFGHAVGAGEAGDDAGASNGHGDHEGAEESVAWEPGRDGRGGALVFRGEESEFERQGRKEHHHEGPCSPTAEQQAAADRMHRETVAALQKYDNNPALALADGFYFVVGPTDRYVHMVAPERIGDPRILVAEEIESFMYAVTDRGLVAIGGMYMMPTEFTEQGMRPTEPSAGPEFGGCLTRWHDHGAEGFGALFAGGRTPEMLHVWTYPGLEPYGHYDGRDLAHYSTPGSYLPMLCRETEDHSVCTP